MAHTVVAEAADARGRVVERGARSLVRVARAEVASALEGPEDEVDLTVEAAEGDEDAAADGLLPADDVEVEVVEQGHEGVRVVLLDAVGEVLPVEDVVKGEPPAVGGEDGHGAEPGPALGGPEETTVQDGDAL